MIASTAEALGSDVTCSRRMSTRLKSRVAVAALVAVVGGALAGCGGSDDTNGDDSSTAGSSSGTTLTKENFATVIGEAMIKSGSVHVVMEASGGGSQTMTATGDQTMGSTTGDSAISMTMDTPGAAKTEIRLIDQVLYINLGQASDHKFAKIDLTDQRSSRGLGLEQFATQMDLSKQFEIFQDSLTNFEQAGDAEQIDGVKAKPYRISVDAAKLAKATRADASQLPEELTYTFYVGPDDLVRRMVTSVGAGKVTTDFSRWGRDVTIEKPEKSEVTDDAPFAQSGLV